MRKLRSFALAIVVAGALAALVWLTHEAIGLVAALGVALVAVVGLQRLFGRPRRKS
ncbi:MAG: hypothetical protein VYE22_00635 [Myxococcota bacterium]|nr:hypothetical protein [Myxococcota bacterium]